MGQQNNPYKRHQRVAAQLQREIAAWLRTHLDAPLNVEVTLTRVQVARDLSAADCFFLTPEGTDPGSTLEQLAVARFDLQRYLGENLRMKRLPRLEFRYDKQYEHAAKIDRILQEVAPADGAEGGTDR